jgi:chromate reductase
MKMADTMNVLVICGSLRKGSFNAALTRALPELTPPGMTLVTAPTYENFPLYNADIPEYNWSRPGPLKNAIDWVSRIKDQPFKEKPVAIQSCSQGPLGGARMQYHWRMSMTFLGAYIFGTPEVFVGLAQTKFDKDTLELKDQATKDVIKTQLAAFGKYITRMKAAAKA